MTSSKHDNANYEQFAPNFGVADKTMQGVSVPNLKLFGPMKTELWGKKVKNFLLCCMGKWNRGNSFPTNMAAAYS